MVEEDEDGGGGARTAGTRSSDVQHSEGALARIALAFASIEPSSSLGAIDAAATAKLMLLLLDMPLTRYPRAAAKRGREQRGQGSVEAATIQ